MRASSSFAVFCVLLNSGALGFAILPGDSLNHQEITEDALLSATLLACRNIAQSSGTVFTFPPRPYSTGAVAAACSATESSKSFRQAVRNIIEKNTRVDLRHPLNISFHFDDESFVGGRSIIATGLSAVKASNRQGNFEAAREILGEIFHPLQDFYSHSNWVELGNELPNSNLLRSDAVIGNIAAVSVATCRDCDGDDCRNNILPEILQANILTSGYFDVVPFLSTKPNGKCSHGGGPDQTSLISPRGGINKDTESASHGHLHREAARVAIAATMQVLDDVGQAAGDNDFLRLMGIFKGSSKALCFVIDTTDSMSDDIAAVIEVTAALVSSKVGTSDEPSVYILVPFNDPEFGPLIRTTDPDAFKAELNALRAEGGGDSPEMSLSGLKLALTGAPSESEIFVFTDASAKDSDLTGAVTALIERTKTVVNFMLTGTAEVNSRSIARMPPPGALLYRHLAQISGGLSVELTKAELSQATTIITESSTSSLVTLFQASRSPGKNERFSFAVDDSVRSLTTYITGSSLSYTLTDPSGTSQTSSMENGDLGAFRAVGNLQTLQLTPRSGIWFLDIVSTNPYTLKVIGQSDIDFIFDFVELSEGTFTGLEVLTMRPRTGQSGALLLSLTDSAASLTEVLLVEPQGAGQVSGVVERRDGGEFLARFSTIPAGEFVVLVKGATNRPSAVAYQRQAPTTLRSSNITVRTTSENIIVPGTPFLVRFSVATLDVGGNFTVLVTDDRGFVTDFPSSLVLADMGNATGTVTLSARLNTPSGSDVTLTIQVEAPGGADSNYDVERYSVFNTVTDFQAPACRLIRREGDCSGNCTSSGWEVVVDVSDPSGVGRVDLTRGNGTLSTSVVAVSSGGQNTTRATYAASCCSPDATLRAVDGVGNVGNCRYSATEGSSMQQSGGSVLTWSCLTWVVLAWALVCPAC